MHFARGFVLAIAAGAHLVMTKVADPVEMTQTGSSGTLLAVSLSHECSSDYVDCVEGFDRNTEPRIACSSRCGSHCCVGTSACTGFTGMICKDGSCSGEYACFNAKVVNSWVVNSCKGDNSCEQVAFLGKVGSIVNSCTGSNACAGLGYMGRAGFIHDSCNAYESCYQAGGMDAAGSIANLDKSCNKYKACRGAGSKYAREAIFSNMTNCCNHERECEFLRESRLRHFGCDRSLAPTSAESSDPPTMPESSDPPTPTVALEILLEEK